MLHRNELMTFNIILITNFNCQLTVKWICLLTTMALNIAVFLFPCWIWKRNSTLTYMEKHDLVNLWKVLKWNIPPWKGSKSTEKWKALSNNTSFKLNPPQHMSHEILKNKLIMHLMSTKAFETWVFTRYHLVLRWKPKQYQIDIYALNL